MVISVSAFYKFVRIDDLAALRTRLLAALKSRAMKGTILVAPEGINGTVSGTADAMAGFLVELRADPRFADLVAKNALADAHPFQRLKVKRKREILTFGHPEADPTVRPGTYVAPRDWNALISDPDVIVVDTRNAYEVEAGSFKGARDPGTRTFGQFAAFVDTHLAAAKDRRVALFCTGGIRCEKATAYLKARGFDEVYHLEGGILNYLAQIPRAESLWQGTCFVFDERGGVDGEAG